MSRKPPKKNKPGYWSLSARKARELKLEQRAQTEGALAADDLPLPDPRAMERHLAALPGYRAGDHIEDDVSEAQEIMYSAWSAEGGRRVALARKALAASPDCADAYVLLAEEAVRSLEEARALYEQGVQAGERALGSGFIEENAGHLWGLLEARPYMRAREGLGEALWALGRHDEAIAYAHETLRLNRNDNQGIRDRLVVWLLDESRNDEAQALLDAYPDDVMAPMRYGRVLAALRLKGPGPDAAQALRDAREINAHVPAFLLGRRPIRRRTSGYVTIGGEDEASVAARSLLRAWQDTPGALEWLAEQVDG